MKKFVAVLSLTLTGAPAFANNFATNMHHINHLCKVINKQTADTADLKKRTEAEIEEDDQVFNLVAKQVDNRKTREFLKAYHQEELETRQGFLKPLAEVIGGDGKSDVSEMIDGLISDAKIREKSDQPMDLNCGVDELANIVQFNGVDVKNRTETEKFSRQILHLALLPKAHRLTPVFCSERLLQAKLNFEAMTKEEFVQHAAKTLETIANEKRVVELNASPRIIGKIVVNVARHNERHLIDGLHGVTILKYPKTVQMFVNATGANADEISKALLARDKLDAVAKLKVTADEELDRVNRDYRKFAKEINPDHETPASFNACAK